MTGGPQFTSKRLEFWLPQAEDRARLFEIVSHPETARFLGPEPDHSTHFQAFLRGAGSWFLYGYGSFMLRPKGSDELIGTVGIFHSYRGLGEDFDDAPEVGWILGVDHVGQGIGSEAMLRIIEWFEAEHGRRRIVCMIETGNAASIALAHKLGFKVLREAELPDGDAVVLFERPARAEG